MKCPSCNAELPATAKFCGACGATLSVSPPQPGPPQQGASPPLPPPQYDDSPGSQPPRPPGAYGESAAHGEAAPYGEVPYGEAQGFQPPPPYKEAPGFQPPPQFNEPAPGSFGYAPL